jgi:hypothetical protein
LNKNLDTHINPAIFGLASRITIYRKSNTHFVIVKNRKSRIVMHDGRQLLSLAKKIWHVYPHIRVSLQTTAPVCSKTLAFLADNNIDVINIKTITW